MAEKILTVAQAAEYFTRLAKRKPDMRIGVGRMEYVEIGFTVRTDKYVEDADDGSFRSPSYDEEKTAETIVVI